MNAPDISFPNLGISIHHLIDGITLPLGNGFTIKFYGILIGIGVLAGYALANHCAKREKISSETILDFLIYALIFSIIGARTYYVVFSWDYYKENLIQIFNLRGGGLAIYGGVIAAILTLLFYTRLKKISFLRFADCCVPGLALGQCIGRWGNFLNCEAFGDYTNSLFAMRIKTELVNSSFITENIRTHLVNTDGASYIQVHPTFFYESAWNLGVILILLLVHRNKKFDGQIFYLYLLCYGLGRIWIEGLRTDQLLLSGTQVAVSQVLSGILVLLGVFLLVKTTIKKKNENKVAK